MDQTERQVRSTHSQTHVCPHCSLVFVQKSDMDAHILLNHTVDQLYVCEICKVHHDTLLEARKHMDSHIMVKTYKCKLCDGYFRNQTSANNHILNIHGNEGGVGLVEELTANVSENHQTDDIVIDLKSKPCFRTQIKTGGTRSKSYEDSVTTVAYVERAQHSFSTVVNGKHKTYVLHIKGEKSHNANTAVRRDVTTEKDRPKQLGIVYQNDGSVEIDTVDESNTGITDVENLNFGQNVSDNDNFNIRESDKENRETNNVKNDMNINAENIEAYNGNEELQDLDEADEDHEFQDVSDNLEVDSELVEFFQNDAPKSQSLSLASAASVQTKKPNHVKNPTVVRNSKLTCEICHKTLGSKSAFRAHLKIHDGVKPYICLICNRLFRKMSHLQDHVETHKGDARKRDYECNVCQKKFFDRRVLRSHMKIHVSLSTNVRQFKCEVCHKSFKRKSHLQEHTVVHLKHRPVVCTCIICKTGFKSVSSYNRHMLKHKTGVSRWAAAKKFKCDLCSASYRTQSELIAHEKRLHDEDKPFSCETCYQTFTRIDSLRDHQELHNKNRKRFTCTTCNMTYLTYKSLQGHMACHKDGKPFHCVSCGKRFLSNTSLNHHVKRYHLSQMQGKEEKAKMIIEESEKTKLHRNPTVRSNGDNIVSEKLASVIKDGAKVELHVNGTKVSKTPAFVNNGEQDFEAYTRKIYRKLHGSEKHDVELENENEINGSFEESFEKKQIDLSNVRLENNVSKEIFEDSTTLSEIGGLKNSEAVNENVIQLHSENIIDKDINTELKGSEQTSLLVNAMKVYSGKRKRNEMSKICPLCGAQFTTPQAQVRHVEWIHGNDGEKKRFICEICGISLSSQTYLKNHKHKEHSASKMGSSKACVHVVKLTNQ